MLDLFKWLMVLRDDDTTQHTLVVQRYYRVIHLTFKQSVFCTQWCFPTRLQRAQTSDNNKSDFVLSSTEVMKLPLASDDLT